ncbi:uncharacterized protein LOC123442955 [Hordeum vulgare subsp. vulgare]|uniref:uncharacterized protein LOC123442955 n=1 Tax=Hordeum vulgare subsp. vulgare TaxID=112509 RepID=UPI001D1A39D2|nr:uncharacterized protein LOC123442955 [Hordeum vulgare subsp. vulgare]
MTGKEVVPPLVDVPMQDHPNARRRNYGHYHEDAGPTHFCKVIFAPELEALPLPVDFTKHFPAVSTEFSHEHWLLMEGHDEGDL